jgi:hypothetical protein
MRLPGTKSRILLYFLSIVFISSCKQSPVAEALSDSNRLVIHFIDQGNTVKTVSTEDKAAIKKMIYALDKGEAKSTDCELNGKMIFYYNETELQQINFNSEPDCRYYSFYFNNKQSSSGMTNETANFLQSVKEGLDFY